MILHAVLGLDWLKKVKISSDVSISKGRFFK